MFKLLKPEEEGPRVGEHERSARRETFSKWLPIVDYDADDKSFQLSDNNSGFAWECRPLNFCTSQTLDVLNSLLRQEYPDGAVLQFLLYPDEAIGGILERYLHLKTRDDAVCREAAQRYASHLMEGSRGLSKMRGLPVRTFRLIVTIKSAGTLGAERVTMIEEALMQAGLSPRRMDGGAMMEFLRRIFNRDVGRNPGALCPGRSFRQQVIGADYPIEVGNDGVFKVGGRMGACLTPKTLPKTGNILDFNKLIGGYRGRDDDASQLMNRFLWTATVFFKVTKGDIQRQANTMMMQRAGGSIAKRIGQRVTELDWALDDVENNPYVNLISSLWVFGDDTDELNRGVARVRSLWEKQDFVMQREIAPVMMQAMFIIALPFGLYTGGSNINTIDRDFRMSSAAAARLLPVQADFGGHMNPVLLFVGRKGQLAAVDVFDPGANNYNFLVCANSGAGKSFNTNFIVDNYYGTGALIRIVDIGYSYEKQALIKKGRFIDVGDPANKLVLNPFQSAGGSRDSEDSAANLRTTANILLLMAFSTTGTGGLTETHNTLVKDAVRFAFERDGGERGIDHVYEYLYEYPRHAGDGALALGQAMAREIAFNLRDFCSTGVYGRIFNGKSTFNIASDGFVVLELERLLNDSALFGVISMQVINAITQDLYLSDRKSQRFMLFDEAWKYFGASPLIAGIINEGYRRARKYTGSTGIVTQSLLDLQKFGPAGDIIKANSAFKFLLESDDYEEAVRRGVVEYKGFLLELAKSVKNNRPNYSEILFDTPFGAGVGRLCVDRWTYWMNTSSGGDFSRFREVLAQGLTPLEALNQLAEGA